MTISSADRALLSAAAEGDMEGIKSALGAGADVNAKDDQAKTALHHLTANAGLDLQTRKQIAKFLIQKGADIYARDYGDGTPLRALGQDDADELEQTYTKSGIKIESEYRLVAEGAVVNAAQLDKVHNVDKVARLRQGIALAGDFPGDATVPMRSDYSGFQGDTKLCDLHMAHGVPVVSRKLKSFLDKQVSEGVEFLPVKILDHRGNVASDQYFLLNALAFDCLDVAKSEPRFSSNGTVVRQVKRLVIDSAKVPPGVKIFRIQNYRDPVIFRKEVADAIMAGGFTNVSFVQPRR